MNFGNLGAHSLRCFVATTLVFSPLLQAQVVSTTEHQVLSPASLNDEYFGDVVAVSGDTVVVGGQRAVVNGAPSAGRAYVYRLLSGTWSLEAVLTSSDNALGQRFGNDVAIDGDRIVVGAPGDSVLFPNAGAAYVFDRSGSTWTET